MWDSLVWVWGREYVLCVGQFGAGLGECDYAACGFGGVCLCCVWGSMVWDWGSENLLFVGQFGLCLG